MDRLDEIKYIDSGHCVCISRSYATVKLLTMIAESIIAKNSNSLK